MENKASTAGPVVRVKRELRKPKVVVFVRHAGKCAHLKDELYPGCDCAKWLRWSLAGRQHREPANTRSWEQAERERAKKQKAFDIQFLLGANPDLAPAVAASKQQATLR